MYEDTQWQILLAIMASINGGTLEPMGGTRYIPTGVGASAPHPPPPDVPRDAGGDPERTRPRVLHHPGPHPFLGRLTRAYWPCQAGQAPRQRTRSILPQNDGSLWEYGLEDMMSRDLMDAVKAEIARLEKELEHDLRYRCLEHLRHVLALYGEASADVASAVSRGEVVERAADSAARAATRHRRVHRLPSPERARAMLAAKDFLVDRVNPISTRAIMEHLNSLGIEVPGIKPLNNLSAMLSNTDDFESHGRKGWTVRQPAASDDDAKPDDNSTPESDAGIESFDELEFR